MRWIMLLVAVLLAPATAHAGTIAREGSELVYRSAPGEADEAAIEGGRTLTAESPTITAGAGCRQGEQIVYCPTAGVTVTRVLAGDGDDQIIALGGKIVVDLGPGDDEFAGGTRNTVVDGGPGNDELALLAEYGASGPQHAEGGDGDDVLTVAGRHGTVTLSGGPGNDRFTTDGQGAPGIALACGPGDDAYTVGPLARPGDGCAPFLDPGRLSRGALEGTLSAPAYGTVTLRRAKGRYDRPGQALARGVFSAGPGPLRVRLESTARSRRVHVTVRLRAGAERGTIVYRSGLE